MQGTEQLAAALMRCALDLIHEAAEAGSLPRFWKLGNGADQALRTSTDYEVAKFARDLADPLQKSLFGLRVELGEDDEIELICSDKSSHSAPTGVQTH